MSARRPAVVMLHSADVIEDYLDPLGLSLDAFLGEMSGGWLFGYMDALRRADVDSTLVCVSRGATAERRLRNPQTGARFTLVPAPRAYRAARESPLARRAHLAPYLATPLRAVARELRSSGASALLCQEYESARFDACVALGGLVGVPVFASFQSRRAARRHPLRPLTVRAARGLIVGPGEEARRVRDRYGLPERRVARIFNPLDASLWHASDRADARAALGLPERSVVIAWHGRVEIGVKGLDVLLSAWSSLRALRPDVDLRLLLSGAGGDADRLRALVRRAPEGIHWHDRFSLDRERIRRQLAAADVYAFPSRREGFPVAPIEAMACGLPVVAAAAEGVEDIFAGGEASGGVIVPTGDPEAFRDGLARLAGDASLRRELGRRARERVERAFSLEGVGAQLRAVLVDQRTASDSTARVDP